MTREGWDDEWLRKYTKNLADLKPEPLRDRKVVKMAVAAGYAPLVGLCRGMGIAEPIPEFAFHPVRKWRFDYAWPLSRIALEIDGGIWTEGRHTRGKGKLGDMEKMSEAAILGWRVLYGTPDDLRNGNCLDRISRALAWVAA